MNKIRLSLVLVASVVLAVLLWGWRMRSRAFVVVDDRTAVIESVVLVGDAGDISPDMAAMLHREAMSTKGVVVMLGDNIYPAGLRPVGHPERGESLRRLMAQVYELNGAPARAVFIPGNHDWDESGPDGLNAVLRQQEVLRTTLGEGSFGPRDGCPGPEEVYRGAAFQVIAFDSEWFKTKHGKSGDSVCGDTSPAAVARKLRQLVESRGTRRTIVAQHHPLRSVGGHGRRLQEGSSEAAPQRVIGDALRGLAPNILCAAGHDHSLQVLAGDARCSLYVVSGSGSYSREVYPDADSLFAKSARGLVRVDHLVDGSYRVTVKELSSSESSKVRYQATW